MNSDDEEYWANYIWELSDGQRFARTQQFGRSKKGQWWVASTTTAPTASGQDMVQIVEIVPTVSMGVLALYRRWLIGPDGDEVAVPWRKPRSKLQMMHEPSLRGTLNRSRFRAVAPDPELERLERDYSLRLVHDGSA